MATVLFERKTKMTDRDPGDDCQGDIIERRRISASRSRLYGPALVAVGIGLMLSLIAAFAVGRWEQRVTKVEFEGVAATELIVMQNGINEYLSRLVTLRTCSNPPTRRLPGASSRFSAAGCLRIIRGFFASAGCRGSTERSVPTTRPRRSMMASPAIRSDLSRRMVASSPAPESKFYFPVFFSTEIENFDGLRAGLFDRADTVGDAGARAG